MEKSSTIRIYQEQPLNPLEAKIAITALHNTSETSVLHWLNLQRDPRFTQRAVQNSRIDQAMGPSVAGMMADATGIFTSVFLLAAGLALLGTVRVITLKTAALTQSP